MLPRFGGDRKFRLLREWAYGREWTSAARLKNPTVADLEDIINQPVYDSFTVAANTAFPLTTLFAQPIGQGGKTRAQTNMVLAGQLPAPQRLIVYAIRLFIANDTTITDVNAILRNVSVQFFVGVKKYFEGPCLLLTAGCGAILSSAAQVGTAPAGSAPLFASSNGEANQRNVFALTRPVVIEAGETFNMIFTAETGFNTQAGTTNPAGVGTVMFAILDGELYRQVQ